MISKIVTAKDIKDFFPKTIEEIESLANKAIEEARANLKTIIEIDDKDRDFQNTVYNLDMAAAEFYEVTSLLFVIESVYPEELLRNAAHHNSLKLNAFFIDNFSQNIELYKIIKKYNEEKADKENLNGEQKYYLKLELEGYERNGLHLSPEKQDRLKNLKKELGEHELQFERNIAEDARAIEVTQDELAGLSQDFINRLKKTEMGKYILGVDYPTFFAVIEQCQVSQTRKALWTEFVNRAYPENKELLAQIIALRDELAITVGYKNFAELDISSQMAKTIETVQSFINDLIKRADPKVKQELDILSAYVFNIIDANRSNELVRTSTDNIALTENGQFKPWDLAYIKNSYKKKFLDIDEEKISEFFPLENTIEKLLYVFEQFLGLTFEKSHLNGLWNEHVEYITVYDKDQFVGSLLLDLFPRPGKFTHACFAPIVPTIKAPNGEFIPALGLVIANFPAPAAGNTALLKLNNVNTFFHEFGHAIHGLLGTTLMPSFSGTNTKRDFVEMPSQMLEEWLQDLKILKLISKHYITGESLPEELIKKIINLKHFDSGYWIKRQAYYSMLSLDLFKDSAYVNIEETQATLYKSILSSILYDSNNHDFASFGHLVGYGAKYYGYLWSKVFALDLFSKIKEHGLLNQEIGKKYIKDILSKGGSVDPKELIRNFLGREPRTDPFFKDMGI